MRAGGLAIVLASLVAGGATGAAAEPAMSSKARAHYDAGMSAYRARDYPAAIKEFQAGYAIEPLRELLFAEAQAERLGGNCPRAVTLYQRFLDSQPPPAQVEATQIGLKRCQQDMAARPPAPSPPIVAAAPALPAPPPRPWYRDRLGAGLLGGAAVGTGVGLAFVVAALAAEDAAGTVGDYAASGRHQSAADLRWTAAAIGLGAGAALLGASALRYAWVARHGGGIGVGGSF